MTEEEAGKPNGDEEVVLDFDYDLAISAERDVIVDSLPEDDGLDGKNNVAGESLFYDNQKKKIELDLALAHVKALEAKNKDRLKTTRLRGGVCGQSL